MSNLKVVLIVLASAALVLSLTYFAVQVTREWNDIIARGVSDLYTQVDQ